MFCRQCGAQLSEQAAFCGNCGAAVQAVQNESDFARMAAPVPEQAAFSGNYGAAIQNENDPFKTLEQLQLERKTELEELKRKLARAKISRILGTVLVLLLYINSYGNNEGNVLNGIAAIASVILFFSVFYLVPKECKGLRILNFIITGVAVFISVTVLLR